MNSAERDDMIFIKKVKIKCALIHDIKNSEEKTLKQ